jgi:EEF1A N-terminal glycine/lysine methyltransferase
VRNSLISTDNRISAYSAPSSAYGTGPDPFAPPTASNSYLGVPSASARATAANETKDTTTWHGVCLTVWSHADAERSTAIRRALEATNGSRGRKESAHSVTSSKLKALRAERRRRGSNLPLNNNGNANDVNTEGETDGEGISDSEYDAVSVNRPGGSTLFLPGDTVFWLPYALSECSFLQAISIG